MNLFVFAGIIGDIATWFQELWMNIWFSLNDAVYSIIELLYQVFMAVANVNLFSDEVFKTITDRIYIVMAIAMLFIFAYNIILMIINPDDKKSTGQTTQFVKDIIISLVLIILLPTVFNYMSVLQRHILDSNIIGKIIVGGISDNDDCDFSKISGILDGSITINTSTSDLSTACNNYKNKSDAEKGASSISPILFSAFFHPKKYGYYECKDFLYACGSNSNQNMSCNTEVISGYNDSMMCAYYFYDVSMAKYLGTLSVFSNHTSIYNSIKQNTDILEFNYLLAFVSGIFALYMFVCYTIAIGVRVAKLGFLQIISPIAVMMRMIPKQKEKFFDKWVSQLTNTYFDVFIRLAIIYFALFAISLVPDVIHTIFSSFDGNFLVKSLSMVVIILGILKFGQDAPALIKEFIGDAARFKLESPRKQFSNTISPYKEAIQKNGVIGGIAGGAAGGFLGGARNYNRTKSDNEGLPEDQRRSVAGSTARGILGGMYYGAKNGSKNGIGDFKGSLDQTASTVEENRTNYNDLVDTGDGSYIRGQYRARKAKLGRSIDSFGDYVRGDVPDAATGSAAQAIMSRVDNMEAQFKNADIANIEDGRAEANKLVNSGKDFSFSGTSYHKIDNDTWTRNGDPNSTISHDDLKKLINDYYKNDVAKGYARSYTKSPDFKEAFKTYSDTLIEDLRNNMPKMGETFSKSLFNKMNELGVNVNTLDELNNSMKTLVDSNNPEDLAKLYKISDEIKGLAKGVDRRNALALEQQKARQDANKAKDKKE